MKAFYFIKFHELSLTDDDFCGKKNTVLELDLEELSKQASDDHALIDLINMELNKHESARLDEQDYDTHIEITNIARL